MDTLKFILERRSIRRYTKAPVSREILLKLAKAGMSAPSSRDTRHFRFIIVDDPLLIDRLGTELPYSKMLLTARHAIVVASDLSVAHGGSSTDYWVQDCSAAAENILIAAKALNLGACWTAAHPRQDRVAIVKKILCLPEGISPLCVIAVGVPTGDDRPRDKFNSTHVHFNQWDGSGQ
ncbi:MAG: nitroreductase family protein [Candidatus Omnitrophica bacterium]|nr:nitroreductase family protein [Candidatus Omnitrophota bacterium]